MDAVKQRMRFALPEPEGIPIAHVVQAMRRHAPLIVLLAVVGAVGAYAFARTQPKHYTASSLIAVEGDRFAIPELQGALRAENAADPMPFVRTEMQAIASRDLIQSVVNQLHLIDIPEFNSDLRAPSLLQQIKTALQSLLPNAAEVRSEDGPNNGVVNALASRLMIFQDNRSLAIEVSVSSEDAKLSSEIVNTLITTYVAAQSRRRSAANQGANQAMTTRIEQVRQDVAALEKQMLNLRSSNEMVNLRAGSIGQQQIEELATAAARASIERSQLETTYQRATSQSKQGVSDALASVLNSSTVAQLREQEATASKRVADLSSQYGSNYPDVRSAKAQLSAARSQLAGETQRIVSSLGSQLHAAQDHEAEMKRQLDDARKAAVASENARAQLDQLQQEVTTRRSLYQTLLERAQQTVNQPADVQTPDVHVITTATPPGSPSGPNMKLAAGLGGAGGSLLGLLFALGRVRIAAGSMTPEELATNIGLSILATFSRRLLGRGRDSLVERVVMAPRGGEAQTLRTLRDRVRKLGRSVTPRLVMITSLTDAKDGPPIAAAFARVASDDGERVLLLDAGFQQPGVSDLLGIPTDDRPPSLTDGTDWRELVTGDPETSLEILAFQRPTADRFDLLSGTSFQNLLVEAGAFFDLVVLTAPAVASKEAQALAERVDAVLLVVHEQADRQATRHSMDQFSGLSLRNIGLISICK